MCVYRSENGLFNVLLELAILNLKLTSFIKGIICVLEQAKGVLAYYMFMGLICEYDL